MMGFKQFCEDLKWVANSIQAIWKNPTNDEIDDIPGDVRAFAMKNGDLFIINQRVSYTRAGGFVASHIKMAGTIRQLYGVLVDPHNADVISLVRKRDTNAFFVGDDDWARWHSSDRDNIHKKRKSILKRTKKKNGHWVFFYGPKGNL